MKIYNSSGHKSVYVLGALFFLWLTYSVWSGDMVVNFSKLFILCLPFILLLLYFFIVFRFIRKLSISGDSLSVKENFFTTKNINVVDISSVKKTLSLFGRRVVVIDRNNKIFTHQISDFFETDQSLKEFISSLRDINSNIQTNL